MNFRTASRGILSSRLFAVNSGNQSLCSRHVVKLGLAKGLPQRLFFHRDSVHQRHRDWQQHDKKSRSIPERKREASER